MKTYSVKYTIIEFVGLQSQYLHMFIQSHFITIFLRKAAVISPAKGLKRFITIPSFYITKQNFRTYKI